MVAWSLFHQEGEDFKGAMAGWSPFLKVVGVYRVAMEEWLQFELAPEAFKAARAGW